MYKFSSKLQKLKGKIRLWNKTHFGNVTETTVVLEESLHQVEEQLMEQQFETLLDQERILIHDLSKAYLNEEMLWRQKSRIRWLKGGDKNTKFFHMSTMLHRSHNKISSLVTPNGTTLTLPEEIDSHIVTHFQSILSDEGAKNPIA